MTLSIISRAAGSIPAAIMAETARLASLMSMKSASSVMTICGVRVSRTVTLVVMPERAFAAHEGAEQIITNSVRACAAKIDHFAGGNTTSRPRM